jgi:hypothetical protein
MVTRVEFRNGGLEVIDQFLAANVLVSQNGSGDHGTRDDGRGGELRLVVGRGARQKRHDGDTIPWKNPDEALETGPEESFPAALKDV